MSKNSLDQFTGTVLSKKAPDDRYLRVHSSQILPCYTGNAVPVLDGKSANYIDAEWRDESSNTMYPPDINQGEAVILYQLANSHKWYWKSDGRNKDLRTTEQSTTGYMANPAPHTSEEMTIDNMYTQGVDTTKGEVNLFHTSQKNEEPFGWSCKVDTKSGIFTLSDSTGCQVVVEPGIPQITLSIPNQSYVRLTGKVVNIMAAEDIILCAKRQLVIDSPAISHSNQEGGGTTVLDAKNVSINASESFTITAPATQFDGNVVMPQTAVIGEVWSPSYNAAAVGTPHTPSEINIGNGDCSSPSNPPNPHGENSVTNERNGTGWQNIDASINAICDALSIIESSCLGKPSISGQISTARQESKSSKMERLKGE
jgi:hypothetical protein